MDESVDEPSLKRDVPEPFSHIRADEVQQPDETVQSSFTLSPIETHFVVPKEAVTAENIQSLFESILFSIDANCCC